MEPAPSRGLDRLLLDALSLRRVQLISAMLIGGLAPAMIRWRFDWIDSLPTPAHIAAASGLGVGNTMIGATLAMVMGYVTWRQLKAHPGAGSGGYVLYAFGMSFAGLAVALMFLRVDYSRYQLIAGYVLTTVWFLVIDQMTRRHTVLRLAFLPSVSPWSLPSGAKASWHRLAEPTLGRQTFQGVVADLRADMSPEWERFLAHCALQGLPVYDVRQIHELLTGKVKLEHLSENTLSSTLARLVYVRVKRLGDLAAVVLTAPIVAPLIAIAAVAIKLESPGAALFTQTRMGHRGETFTIYKLRSMRCAAPGSVGAAGAGGEHFTQENDDRITRVGAFIRKYRIDELPQIWNILKGDMSWIGPRPEAVALADWYEREVPFYCYRHMVRPGITGWAQVNQGNVAQINAATEKLHYDFYYIKNVSPWLDLLIGAKTVQTVLTGFGAR